MPPESPSSPRPLRVGLAQIDTTVGAIDRNVEAIRASIGQAKEAGVALLLVPELAVSGYPPEDLLLRDDFVAAARDGVDRLAATVGEMVVCVGAPGRDTAVRNSLFVLQHGRVRAVYDKVHLPNYGVFDERRYFTPGPGGAVIGIGDELVGLTVCEDIWLPGDPLDAEGHAGATLVVNVSASPYHRGKLAEREVMIEQRCREGGFALAYCNAVGGQDELVFDGASFVCDHSGRVLARAAQFAEELLVCDIPPARARPAAAASGGSGRPARLLCELGRPAAAADAAPARLARPLGDEAEVYAALVLGTRDYVRKAGFERVLLGLSGGIDSALVAVVACDAVGPDRVTCVVMPSRYSSAATQDDARSLARRLGAALVELPIDGIVSAYADALSGRPPVEGPDTTMENIQARARGNLLMALSNRYGGLLLSTGNKSEMSVGYATLYGDMAGGFAVIKDVPKTLVQRLCRWLQSTRGETIPPGILERPPSAELAFDQRDTDSLPPYDLLDPILELYVERDASPGDIVRAGFNPHVVRRVIAMVDRAEYKRRQAPPGVKITTRAFGRDRRLPVAGGFVHRFEPAADEPAAAAAGGPLTGGSSLPG